MRTEQEQEDLCEALAAAVELAGRIEEKTPYELGLKAVTEKTKKVLMLERQDGAYVLGEAAIPKKREKQWPAPEVHNDISIAKLKKMKRTGVWECEIIRHHQPVQNAPEEIPVFPVAHYEDNPEELLEQFMDALLQHKICPAELKVRDQRTYAFAKAFCGKLKITVSIEPELPVLDEAEFSLLEHFDMDEEVPENMMNILDEMLQMDDEAGSQRADSKALSDQSYIISVSLSSGCYRHIQISCSSTLFELHAAILDAFDFMDDHAHAFFMDNQAWSQWDCYYAKGFEKNDRTTDRYRLDQVGLHKEMKFKYIFDFGDEWTFQCKVLRIVEGRTLKPLVVRSKGAAPDQYGGW